MSIADKLTYLNETKQQLREAINAAFGAGLTEADTFRSYVYALPFWPGMLFLNGEQGAWYDPTDLGTLFQDAAGTTPVTADGDPVGLMLDLSGNGNHASQSVSGARPIYRTDGTLHWLETDGVDDNMDFTLSEEASIYVVAASEYLSADGRLFGHMRSGGARYGMEIRGSSVRIRRYPGPELSASGVAAKKVVEANLASLGPFLWANGKEADGTSGFSISSTLATRLFSDQDGSFPQGAAFFGATFLCDKVPSDRDSVRDYFANLAGVTL